MTPRSLIPANSVILSPRIAAMFEYRFDLTQLRVAVRGKDAELDDALSAIRVAAMSFDDETTLALASAARKRVAEAPEVEGRWLSTSEVADVADCEDRTVRLAATEGRLEGHKDHMGRWQFEPPAVVQWMTTRPGRQAA